MLQRLYEVGVNGKCWRLMKSWYEGATCQVKVDDGMLSEPYSIQRGVKQGSVLSPPLFLLVMDPFLRVLEQSGLGLSVNNLYTGGFLHADDIRTLATSTGSVEAQETMVKDFAAHNFLKLNVEKCEIVMFSHGRGAAMIPQCEVDGSQIPVRNAAMCLGYWWRGDMMASRSVEEKSRRHASLSSTMGVCMGAFQGDLNPLSTRSIVKSCVMPILLFGSENWIVSGGILE